MIKKPFGPPLRLIHEGGWLAGYFCTYCKKDFIIKKFWFWQKPDELCEHIKEYHNE